MAGAGVKLFLSGEIAYAADINQYLMDQSVALFLNEAARNSAFGNGIPVTQAGGDGKPLLTAGRICFLLEGPGSTVGNPIRTIQYYDGSTWVDSAQFTVPDGAVTSAKLNTSVAGNGLSGGAGTALAVNVDDSTIEINSDTLRLKDAGITSAKLASAVAGNGLAGGAGTALSVNVDGSTIEINSDTLRLKDAGITSAKLDSSLSLTGSTSIEQILEKTTVVTGALSATTNLDALSGAVYYSTASTTANITLNLRGDGSTTLASLVPAGKAFSCVFMITSGSVNGKILTVTAGSSTVALKWFGGNVSPAGSSGGSVDVYTITAVKTSDTGNGTFHIFISQSRFG